MSESAKAVMRFNNGSMLKGYLKDFSPDKPEVVLEEAAASKEHRINLSEVKAIFFVRTFEGDQGYKERKTYGIARSRGNRVFIKFRDGEGMVGFLEGDVPWERGFFLSRQDRGPNGFYLLPVDEDTNNVKVFVVSSSVVDVTVVP